MAEKSWAEVGLTDDLIAELYRRGRQYAERCIATGYREDAVQDGMLAVLTEVRGTNCPRDEVERLKYLSTVMYNEAQKRVTRKTPPEMNIPAATT